MASITLILQVFWEFFKIGLFAVGGGPATIPFLFDLSDKTGWYTNQELTNMIAVSESTPGPVGLNMATYVGFKSLGFFGGVVSTFGLVLPSIIVIILIAKFLANFSENPKVKNAFMGIRPTVTGLIFSAVISIWRASLLIITDTGYKVSYGALAVCIVAVILMQLLKKKSFHPAIWLLGGAIAGLIFQM